MYNREETKESVEEPKDNNVRIPIEHDSENSSASCSSYEHIEMMPFTLDK